MSKHQKIVNIDIEYKSNWFNYQIYITFFDIALNIMVEYQLIVLLSNELLIFFDSKVPY